MDMVHVFPHGAAYPVSMWLVFRPVVSAVSVIAVPFATVSVQSVPQLIPVPVTVPDPVPFFRSEERRVGKELLNVAVTVLFAVMDMVHDAPLGVSHTVQLPNVDPAAAAAVR